jgi:hypothetical protein
MQMQDSSAAAHGLSFASACHMVCMLAQATPAGLSEGQAKERLEEYGPNRLPESTINPVVRWAQRSRCSIHQRAC